MVFTTPGRSTRNFNDKCRFDCSICVQIITFLSKANVNWQASKLIAFLMGHPVYADLFWKIFYFVDLFEKNDFVDFFWEYFESIQLIQSYQSLKVNRLSHLLYENELTQSPINSHGKRTESIQSILRKKMNRFKSINSVELIGLQVWLELP